MWEPIQLQAWGLLIMCAVVTGLGLWYTLEDRPRLRDACSARTGEVISQLIREMLLGDHASEMFAPGWLMAVGAKFVGITFGFICVFFLALYTANLTAIYQQRTNTIAIHSIDDLIDHNLTVCYHARTPDNAGYASKLTRRYPSLRLQMHGFQSATDLRTNVSASGSFHNSMVALRSGACHAVIFPEEGYRFAQYTSQSDYCWLHPLGMVSLLSRVEPGWISPYAEECIGNAIEPVLQQLLEQGIMQMLQQDRYTPYEQARCQEQVREFWGVPKPKYIGASLEDVGAPIFVHLVILAIVIGLKIGTAKKELAMDDEGVKPQRTLIRRCGRSIGRAATRALSGPKLRPSPRVNAKSTTRGIDGGPSRSSESELAA